MAYGDLLNKKRQPQFGLPNLGGGDIRETVDPPFIGTPSGATEYGQGSGVIGQGGTAGTWSDMFASTFGETHGVESMSDLYDWWLNWVPQDTGQGFTDWLNEWGGFMDEGLGSWGNLPWLIGGNTGDWDYSDVPYTEFSVDETGYESWSMDPSSQEGSAIGGMGDLGTGSTWLGGGILGEGLWDYDCAQMGPSYGPNGECLACCEYAELSEEDQSWGEYYGTTATEGELDPDFDDDCWGMWEQAEAAGFQGEYDDFANLYCG